MKTRFFSLVRAALCILSLSSCTSKKNNTSSSTLVVATCADYPPFEYYATDGTLKGFDVELAHLIAQELKREIKFEILDFGAILAALETGKADLGISTISITPERKKRFHFSAPYHTQVLYAILRKGEALDFSGKILGCQMGSTMEDWIKETHSSERYITMDENTQLIEALKSKQVDIVVLDGYQAKSFCQMNSELICLPLGISPSSYGIAFPKDTSLLESVNGVLKRLEESGTLDALKRKYSIK